MAYNNDKYQYRQKRNQKPQEPGIEQRVVEGILRGLWWLVTLPFKKRGNSTSKSLLSAASAQQFTQYWKEIQTKAATSQTRDLAIAEADKLLDAALKEIGIPGNTMGDRLKASQGLFPDQLYNQVWEAHKLRNRLAHEMGAEVSAQELSTALSAFQWALRTLGVFI